MGDILPFRTSLIGEYVPLLTERSLGPAVGSLGGAYRSDGHSVLTIIGVHRLTV